MNKYFGCIKAAQLLQEGKAVYHIGRKVVLKARFRKSGKVEIWYSPYLGNWNKECHEDLYTFKKWYRGEGAVFRLGGHDEPSE